MAEKGTGKKFITAAFGIVGILMATVYIILCFKMDAGHMLPKTIVNDIDLSGMTLEQAEDRLDADAKARCEEAVLTVSMSERFYTVDAGNAMELDCEMLAKEAFRQSRCGFLGRGALLLQALVAGYQQESLPAIRDMQALYREIEASGLLDADSTIQTSYQIDNDKLIFTMGTAGYTVDKGKLANEIIAAVQEENYESIILCPGTLGIVEPVDLEQVYQEVCIEAVNATLDPGNDYQIVGSVMGISFDQASAKKVLDTAEEGSRVAIDLIYTEPEITTQDMQEHLFADRLAAYTTRVTGSVNRLTNISLAVEKCDGAILLSNEEFSFNDIVGDQTEETGFKISEGVENGKIVPAYGGGICQVSSTIFVAALYADLEIVERWNHDLVSSYVPAGLDAAVAWGELDFRFANNTDYPVKVEIDYENGYLTVTILGTKMNDESVEIELERLSSNPVEVITYRKVYDPVKDEVFTEQVGYSKYM